MRRLSSRILIHAVPLWLAFAAPAWADLWYEHYEKGEAALKAKDWKTAAQEFTSAIEKRGEPGVQVRTYGMNFINYHPFFRLGIAYSGLGQTDAALQAFETEQRLGAIAQSAADLKSLRDYIARTTTAKNAEGAAATERVTKAVAESLKEAGALEQQGKLDEAMAALGKALAVDPENTGAVAAMDRLRGLMADQQSRRETGARVAKLITAGRDLLDAGRLQEASSSLNQAVLLQPDNAEARGLLDRSQARLREEIEAQQGADQRQTLIRDALADAARKEQAGQIAEALGTLQKVLAVEPANAPARDMLARLARLQDETDRLQFRAQELARMVQDGEGHFNGGRFDQSLTSFNRALALDPQNGVAQGYLGRLYRWMSGTIVGDTRRAPEITFNNLPNVKDEDGAGEQRVSSAEFVLSGSVIDDQPVQISIQDGRDRVVHEAVLDQNQKTFGLYVNRFQQRFELVPGRSTLKVMVRDPDDSIARAEYRVHFVLPLWKKTWFRLAIGILLLSTLGVVYGHRVHRRNLLLKRRFNPYVAGAPVLNDDLFVGRELLLSRILQTIHNNSILLYGERRIGKTSLQHHLKKRLQQIQDPEYEFYPVFVDLQGTPQERFFATLADDVFGDLAPVLEGAGVQREALDGRPYDYGIFILEIRQVLAALRKRSPKKVKLVLLIDEVDELNNYDPRVNQRLRSLFMKSFAEDLVAVVSGVGIKKHWASEGSPWYNFFEEIEVRPFTREDAEDLIARPIRGIFKLEEGVVDRIIDNTGCKPYLIQKSCVALVNRMHDERRRRITVADVEAVGRPVEA